MELDAITPDLVRRALSAWNRSEDPPDELLALDFLGLGGVVERRFALHEFCLKVVAEALTALRASGDVPAVPPHRRSDLEQQIAADFSAASTALEAWSAVYYRYLESVFRLSVADIQAKAMLGETTFRERVGAGIRLLTEAIQRAEQRAHHELRRSLLPPREHHDLVGIDHLSNAIVALLEDPAQDSIVSIEGLGGIGKTTVARHVAELLGASRTFNAVLWVSARQRWLDAHGRIQQDPAAARNFTDVVERLLSHLGLADLEGVPGERRLEMLARIFARERYCIILDNLESIEDVDRIVPAIQQLAGRSRVLLTSRVSVQHLPGTHAIAVPELSLADSARMVESILRHRTRYTGATTLSPDLMTRLYAVVGGIPLGLKLVVSQPLPLPEMLDELSRLRGANQASDRESVHHLMFDHIYRRTWNRLAEPARDLLIAMMDISPDGENVEWLRLVSGLPASDFRTALEVLLDHSLVEIGGSIEAPRYRLHRLTVTFLETEAYRSFSDGQA